MKTILFVTIDPIANRSRVLNAMHTAKELEFKVQAISIATPPVLAVDFPVDYITVPFKNGPLKFAWFNLLLFWRIIFRQYDLIHIRGLWVLPAILLRQIMHPSYLIYDAHEYFAGLVTFEHRHFVKKFWLYFERLGISKSDVVTTVSETIAQKYIDRYPNLDKIEVLRNVPPLQKPKKIKDTSLQIDLPGPLILFHGYFLPQRGLEHLLQAMVLVKKAQLLLVGEGPLETELKKMVSSLQLDQKVHFRSFISQELLIDFAAQADVGVSLLELNSENHRLALPNKFFEYLMAGLPVLVNKTPTMDDYINRYKVGLTVDSNNPNAIAKSINSMLADKAQLKTWKRNCLKAARELCWEKESEILSTIYKRLI